MKPGLSQKIAFLLAAFIFCAVLIFSILTTSLLRKSLLQQKSADLSGAIQQISVLAEQTGSDYPQLEKLIKNAELPFYVLYTLYTTVAGTESAQTPQHFIIATNDPFIPLLPPVKKASRHIEKNFFADGDLNILYLTGKSGETEMQAALYMDTDSLDVLVGKLPRILALVSIPLLVLSFFAALFFTARMLRPVQLINRAAREISAKNLDRRIPENGAGDELEELARTFNNLFARLQNDFERERRFVSDISHELKTPLAVLLGHLDLLRRWGKNDPSVTDKSLETAYTEARAMQTLIENMLLLSKSENQESTPLKTVRLQPLLERLADDTRLIHPKTVCLVSCPETAQLRSNEEILMQVLRILTDNAIRYSAQPAYVAYEFHTQNGNPRLLVRDRGRGVAVKDLPHIFDRLYRADESRNRATGGSGLGLAIARELLLRIRASISAKSPAQHNDGTLCGTEMVIEFVSDTLTFVLPSGRY